MSNWIHGPSHMFNSKGTYIVTAATIYKQHFFQKREQLDLLQTSLFELADHYNWRLEAWAIFSNHYHFVAQSPENPSSLQKFITHLHSNTARMLNKNDNTPGGKIWHQYWDSQLTFVSSYLARLNYVMQNPVKHGLVLNSEEYPWCSSGWFNKNAKDSHKKTVLNFKTDSVHIVDDF
jgi:putative transposase